MQAMVLTQLGSLIDHPNPLTLMDLPKPVPGPNELLIKVSACGVCHTELDEIEGRLPPVRLPMVIGHQVVGRVEEMGPGIKDFALGMRVGVAWIHSACGTCPRCQEGLENLCPDFQATGRDVHGGYAEYMTVPARFAYPIHYPFSDVEAAPLLCAGAIGYRSLMLTELRDGQSLGLMGFGASAHLVLMMVRHVYPYSQVSVFARHPEEREFARQLGAVWVGDIEDQPPEPLAAIIDTTPVWKPLVEALRHLAPHGRLVINAIRKEKGDQDALLYLDYPVHLWMEKEIKSVANVTRRDVRNFLDWAAKIPIRSEIEVYPLKEANQALLDLKMKRVRGAKVFCIDS
jgi:propanol-preferring alcohol dehydrogenase